MIDIDEELPDDYEPTESDKIIHFANILESFDENGWDLNSHLDLFSETDIRFMNDMHQQITDRRREIRDAGRIENFPRGIKRIY